MIQWLMKISKSIENVKVARKILNDSKILKVFEHFKNCLKISLSFKNVKTLQMSKVLILFEYSEMVWKC